MTSYADDLLQDLDSLVELAPGNEDVVAAARTLAHAIAASAATRLLDAMSRAALSLSAEMEHGHVEVRVVGTDPELLYVEDEPPPTRMSSTEESATARITLRLPQRLKDDIETAASRSGNSVNTWLVRTLEAATSGARQRLHVGTRLRGFASG
jgi:hypothetical protein